MRRRSSVHMDLRTLKQSGISIVDLLRGTGLFSQLDRQTLKIVARALSFVGATTGTEVMRQGEPADGLFLVVNGRLQVMRAGPDGQTVILGELATGEIVGEASLVTSEPRSATVRAVVDSLLIRLPRAEFQILLERYPEKIGTLSALIAGRQASEHQERYRPVSNDLIRFLKTVPLFASMNDSQLRELEAHLQWMYLPGGKELMKQGDAPDGLYVVAGGRLSYEALDEAGRVFRSGFFARGDIVGEMALLTGEARSATVTALRDCELIKLTQSAVKRLLYRSPRSVLSLTKTIAGRISRPDAMGRGLPFTSLAVIPVTPSVNIEEFTTALEISLSRHGKVRRINARSLDEALGEGSAQKSSDDAGGEKISAWLSEREEEHDFLLLTGGADAGPWNEKCIRGADRVLLVAAGGDDPKLSPVEVRYLGPVNVVHSPRDLVILQSSDRREARGTKDFLNHRQPAQHYHLREGSRADMDRLARYLTGSAVGLVLGGGGARGAAHIGVIEALLQGSVPIDMICGTSMGALIGGLYAKYGETNTIRRLVREHLVESNPLNDYTFPFISLVRGRRYVQALREVLGESSIEDLPIPYFAVACNLTLAEETEFHSGPAWQAVRASTSLPGIVPPLYKNGQLFVDGGLLNNVPVDLMRSRQAGKIIAVDVSGSRMNQDELYANFLGAKSAAEAPSFFRSLSNKMRRRENRAVVPSLGSILIRSTMIGSVMKVKQAKKEADIYARLPVEKFGLLDWHLAEDLINLGYDYALENLPIWQKKIGMVS